MPQPNSDSHIVSTPACDGQPYDPESGSSGAWVKLEQNAGAADINTGRVTDLFPDTGAWHQV